MDYEGIYYCIRCGLPKHIIRIMQNEQCECGRFGFISCVNFNIQKVVKEFDELE